MNHLNVPNINLLRSLFTSRHDVFAIHWSKGNKTGYMPAYQYDLYMYQLHRRRGGSFKDYKDKKYQPLTDLQLQKHLKGEQLIGIYPLLQDNTSYFIAADFDNQNWKEECLLFMDACSSNNIPSYLERSRSGKGGHVWIFFDQAYPAKRSRKIILTLLEKIGIVSKFSKNSSFDRLFPNQDYLSGKGLGNLIALPFHKPSMEFGNSCFVDPSSETLNPYPDQWEFLTSIRKVDTEHLNKIYQSFTSQQDIDDFSLGYSPDLQIVLNHNLRLRKDQLSSSLINFLQRELNLPNSDFFIKKKSGKSTHGTLPYLNCIEETEHELKLPRGFVGKLLRFCKKQNISYNFKDLRKKLNPETFHCTAQLRPHQIEAKKAAEQKDYGIISAPPGSGKTIIGLQIIADKQQPALIIVHRKHLLDQWVERIQAFLGIPIKEIGRIGQGKVKKGKIITVALIHSLGKHIEKRDSLEFTSSFGTIIIDECHHMPSATFRSCISKLSPYYQYGFTATPFRKGSDGKFISIYLGETIAEIKPQDIVNYQRPRIIIRETGLNVPYNSKTDTFETLSKILIHDSARNNLILKDIIAEMENGRKVIIITERKEHIDTLNQYLKQSFETITLSGEDSENSRKSKWDMLNKGLYQGLITTGQYFGEGSDLQNASCLFLVYPFSFKGKLVQYVGRVQRSQITPVIYDYRDVKINYLNRLFLKRNRHYRQFDKQASLFEVGETRSLLTKNSIIEKTIRVPIEDLDFHFGAVAFTFYVRETGKDLEFEIENDNLRPEFDVLKEYFSKKLKTKFLSVDIYAEFENHVLIAQSANSLAVEAINREIIESVKFQFLRKRIVGKEYKPNSNSLLDLQRIQDNQNSFYNSEEEILQDLLDKEVKHYRQLKYLAFRHEGTILKLRFVLNPFAFVFLLSGEKLYHFVLETLDTEEATYIWHFERNLQSLKDKITDIEKDLSLIRNKGRQHFLETKPSNFSRIIHDYSEERKGFVLWKDLLEERLI